MFNQKTVLITAGLLGGLAVLLGAFGAHALQLEPPQSDWFQTANQYHFYHALALLVLPLLPITQRWMSAVTLAWLLALILFCGSLYLAATSVVSWFWLTPIGGLAFLMGWLLMLIGIIKNKNTA